VKSLKETNDDGIEVFVTNRRKDLQPDALEFKLARTGVNAPGK
jgi:hypothetical protein